MGNGIGQQQQKCRIVKKRQRMECKFYPRWVDGEDPLNGNKIALVSISSYPIPGTMKGKDKVSFLGLWGINLSSMNSPRYFAMQINMKEGPKFRLSRWSYLFSYFFVNFSHSYHHLIWDQLYLNPQFRSTKSHIKMVIIN